jgi:cytochrome b561
LSASGALPIAWSVAIAALIAGCAEFHAAFGALLCALVVLRFMHQLNSPQGFRPRQFARCMSRLSYLMLYSVLLLRFIAELTSVTWHDDGLTLGWSSHFQAAPEMVLLECGQRFRLDLLWGIIALLLIRALSAYHVRADASSQPVTPLRMNTLPQQPTPEVQS